MSEEKDAAAFIKFEKCHRATSWWWKLWGYHCGDCARAWKNGGYGDGRSELR